MSLGNCGRFRFPSVLLQPLGHLSVLNRQLTDIAVMQNPFCVRPPNVLDQLMGIRSQAVSLNSTDSAQKKRACSFEHYRVGGSADHVVVEHAGLAHEFVLLVGRDVRGRTDARGRGEVPVQFLDREDTLDLLGEQRDLLSPVRTRVRGVEVVQRLLSTRDPDSRGAPSRVGCTTLPERRSDRQGVLVLF